MMTATSMLVPLGGLVTAPVLAHGLGAEGRGEMAAALAPATLILGIATLGLPEALTYFVAKRPSITRRALGWTALATAGAGLLSVVAVWFALPFLTAGDPELGRLVMIASLWNVPALVVGVLRGAATGRQMWAVIAWERIALTVLRVVILAALLLAGRLTVELAVLVSVVLPVVSGLVYMTLLTRPPKDADQPFDDPRIVAPLFRYGVATWHGSIASMAIARLADLLMLPLSDAQSLGLFVVAVTIADVPRVVTFAIQGTLFGVSSHTRDPARVTSTSRLTIIVGTLGCVAIGATLPWWIGPVFGDEFTAATVPTLMLLAGVIIMVPGLMASSGLSAWGRPGLRSAAQFLALGMNLTVFLTLVPILGIYGAAWAGSAGTTAFSVFTVAAAARVMKVRWTDFLIPRRADFVLLWKELLALVRRPARRR